MAKYGRFDPRNKKRRNDKYRSDKRKVKIDADVKRNSSELTREIERKFNYK